MVLRVKSGLRFLTIKNAIRDEMQGGDFLSSMSDREFNIFQKHLGRHIRKRAQEGGEGLLLI